MSMAQTSAIRCPRGNRPSRGTSQEAGKGKTMHSRNLGSQWQKTFVRIVKNPTFEVLAAIVAVVFAVWIVVQTEIDLRQQQRAAIPFGQK